MKPRCHNRPPFKPELSVPDGWSIAGRRVYKSTTTKAANNMAMKRYLSITMPDGTKWGVPVDMIARSRAEHYASEFDGDVEKSLAEDTAPLFEDDDYSIEDWAANNMNWSDFDGHQIKLQDAPAPDFQDAWVNGEKELVQVMADEGEI